MKPGATHTSFPHGKRVLVILRTGERFVARFDQTDYKKKHVRFVDHESVGLRKIRAITVYKAAS